MTQCCMLVFYLYVVSSADAKISFVKGSIKIHALNLLPLR